MRKTRKKKWIEGERERERERERETAIKAESEVVNAHEALNT